MNEINLFNDNIKPALLLSEQAYKHNLPILKNHNLKILKNNGYLIYKDEAFIKNKLLGELLGYPPICAQEFEKIRGRIPSDTFTSNFLNYAGIQFNCFNNLNEAITWCYKNYHQKLLDTYSTYTVVYTEDTFSKNLKGRFKICRTKRISINVNNFSTLENILKIKHR